MCTLSRISDSQTWQVQDNCVSEPATNVLSCCSKKKVVTKKSPSKPKASTKSSSKPKASTKSPSKAKASIKPDTKMYKSAEYVKDSDDSSEEDEEEEEEAETKPPQQPLATGWLGYDVDTCVDQ